MPKLPSHFQYSNCMHQYMRATGISSFLSPPPCFGNNSTSDEAEDHQLDAIADERKQRRMISNRESARRSRMRKQRLLDEMWAEVARLSTENHDLNEELNRVAESHDGVVQENARLREETAELRQIAAEGQLGSPFAVFGEFEDVPCVTAHLRAEFSNQSMATSDNMLH